MSFTVKVPPAWDRQQRRNDDNFPFLFSVKFIENVPRSLLSTKDENNVKICIQTCLYDATYKQFFGRCCRGLVKSQEISKKSSEKLLFNYEEDVYFHTCFNDVNIYLVIELIQVSKSEEICLAWTSLQLFKQTDKGVGSITGNFSLLLYYGSSLSLLFVNTSRENHPLIQKIIGCQIAISLNINKSLTNIFYLIPENILISQHNSIPGLKNPRDNSSTLKGLRKLKKFPKTSCNNCIINDIVIHLDITIAKFEKFFCQKFIEEQCQNSSDYVNVLERRLKVGIHNGWNYIEEPHIYHLVLDTKELSTYSDRRNWSFKSKNSQNLILRNKIQLDNIPMDPDIKIIFIVDYVIAITTSTNDSKNLNANIFWAIWSPFPEAFKTESSHVNINLNNDDEDKLHALCQTVCFNGIDKPTENFNIKFDFDFGKKSSSTGTKQKTTTSSSIRSSFSDSINVPEMQVPILKQDSDSTEKTPTKVNPVAIELNTLPVVHASSENYKKRVDVPRILNSHFFDEKIFPPILNRWNQSAIVVDLRDQVEVDYLIEEKDFLQANEIVFQFLGISWLNKSIRPKSLKISFQFYKLETYSSDRLDLISNSVINNFFTIRKVNENNSSVSELKAFQVKYLIDPSHWPTQSQKEFMRYLNKFSVQFHIFDADSLIYLGQCSTTLNKLFRRGREAIQILHQLEIIFPVDPQMKNNVIQVPQTKTQGSVTQGFIHVRLGNIGHPSDPVSKFDATLPVVKSQISLSKSEDDPPERVMRARSFINLESEKSEEKIRKLRRMELVRKTEPRQPDTTSDQASLQVRRLKLIQACREKNKHNSIVNLLKNLIVTQHSVHVSVGSLKFFEYEIFNPCATPSVIFIDIEDPDLKIVESAAEWRYFKQLHRSLGEVEENICSYDNNMDLYQIFLHANEKIKLPFKYQSFKWNFKGSDKETKDISVPETNKKQIKVRFFISNDAVLSVLSLDVHLFYPLVNHHFVFFQEAQVMFERIIRIPTIEIGPDDVTAGNNNKEIYFCCSDSGVHVETTTSEDKLTNNIILRMQSGACCTRRQFFVYLYSNPYLVSPVQTWHVTVITSVRHDITCTLGQIHTCPLVVNGGTLERNVRCWSSDSDFIQISPKEFFLRPCEIHQVQVKTKPTSVGFTTHFINVVDIDDSSIVHSWIICVNCQLPIIGRHFRVDLALNKVTNKKVAFTNSKNESHVFRLRCNYPEAMNMKELEMKLDPGQQWIIGVQFPSRSSPGPTEILLFIDDETGINHEIIAVHLEYTDTERH